MLSLNTFITRANTIHNNKYDYSKSVYVNSKTKLIITCPIHGDFEQTPEKHIRGSQCKECARISGGKRKSKTTEQFITEARQVHGDKYNYDKSVYTGANKKLIITCPEHGDFEQFASGHLRGSGCIKCAGMERTKTTEQFITEARQVHGNKYNYDKSKYIGAQEKLIITCPTHGDFEQQADSHLAGRGCIKCGYDKFKIKTNFKPEERRLTTEEFIYKAVMVHQDDYNYDKVEYKSSKEKIIITCLKHGDFEQKPNTHLTGRGCPVCGASRQSSVSKAEKEIYELLSNFYTKENMITINKSDREILYPNELDLYIPDLKVGIEFNGLYWHSDVFRDSKYHLNKLEQSKEKGIRLIQIFEDEWHNKREIVESRLKHILSKTENKYYARKCYVKEINPTITKIFLDKNHIQGSVQSSNVNLGLFDKETDLLLSVMTFGKLRVSLGNKFSNTNEYELLRFCNKLNSTVVGGANKLLKYFENKYKPKSIISYADKRWSNGGVYFQLGFEHTHDSEPNYYYVDGFERRNRFSFRKDILVSKYGCPENMTEREFCREVLGMNRIYDCGNMVFRKTYVK